MADIDFVEFMSETKKSFKTVSMPDGTIIELPPLELLPDGFFEAAKLEDHVSMGKALIGVEDYSKWTDAGGNAMSLLSLYAKALDIKLPN